MDVNRKLIRQKGKVELRFIPSGKRGRKVWVVFLVYTEGRYQAEVMAGIFDVVKPTKRQVRKALSRFHKMFGGSHE